MIEFVIVFNLKSTIFYVFNFNLESFIMSKMKTKRQTSEKNGKSQ